MKEYEAWMEKLEDAFAVKGQRRDEHGVVHLGLDWGATGWLIRCGPHYLVQFVTCTDAPTCLTCIVLAEGVRG